jgi:sugar phosphate isomerase/epimerase
MRVGLVHFMAYPKAMKDVGVFLATLEEIAADEFFGVVEVTGTWDLAVRERVETLLQSSGLVAAYGAQPTILGGKLNPCSSDEAERAEAERVLLEELAAARTMGAGRLAILSGPDPGRENREQALESLRRTVSSLCRRAAELDMLVVLETFDREVDKRSLLGPSREAAEFAVTVKNDWSNFGVMIDLSHLPLLGESPVEAIAPLTGHLVHAHIGNCVSDPSDPAHGDSHPRFGYPGGDNDVAELALFLRALLNYGYLDPAARPIVSFEVKPLAGESPGAVIAGNKRALREAWALV